MKNSPSKLALVAGILLALAFAFSCSSSDDSGSNKEQSYNYCITTNGCLVGPFTASTCNGQPSNNCSSSSSKAIVSSSSSKAVIQEYCVYRELCGVIEPIGSPIGCRKGTKMDYCPYGYEKINLDLLVDCVNACPYFGGRPSCSKCGGITNNNGTCSVRSKFCNN